MARSATGLREQRIASKSAQLTDLARSWTVERGFSGFTVDELCAAAEVSRRTFFNYFASKDDAVLGVPARADHHEAEERFLAGAEGYGANGLSSTLIPDLAELMITRWEALGIGQQDIDVLIAAIEAAPRLLGRAMQITRDQEEGDILLVQLREQLLPGDLQARTVVHLLSTLLRDAVEESLAGDTHLPLREVFARRLAAARAVFS